MGKDIVEFGKYAKTRSPVYGGVTFERICAGVTCDTQAQQLQQLIGLEFTIPV